MLNGSYIEEPCIPLASSAHNPVVERPNTCMASAKACDRLFGHPETSSHHDLYTHRHSNKHYNIIIIFIIFIIKYKFNSKLKLFSGIRNFYVNRQKNLATYVDENISETSN